MFCVELMRQWGSVLGPGGLTLRNINQSDLSARL